MQAQRYFYLIGIQFLGFRYHGWQKQPGLKTVERMIERTLAYVLGHENFKILPVGRTDAKVSVSGSFIELFLYEKLEDEEEFLKLFNRNLPMDMRALNIEETDAKFNIIRDAKLKEYLYFFSFGQKAHPFCAPIMANIWEDMDIELMQKAAKMFEGEHDFWSYTFKPKPQTQTVAEVVKCEIVENDIYTANFFPEKSYVFRVISEGFKRHQIRLMIGILFQLGRGETDMEFFKQTLNAENRIKLVHIAPASGLILNRVEFERLEK